jgi:hypothetical protein
MLIEQETKNMSEKLSMGHEKNYTEWFLICIDVWVLTFFYSLDCNLIACACENSTKLDIL